MCWVSDAVGNCVEGRPTEKFGSSKLRPPLLSVSIARLHVATNTSSGALLFLACFESYFSQQTPDLNKEA